MFNACRYFQTADGLRVRWVYLPSEHPDACGTVVLLNGRTEYLEKYAETVGEFLRRGWGVASFDWRGQGLSDRLTASRLKGHVGRFRDYLDDLGQFVDLIRHQGADGPLILAGHSMGAHIGLRFIRERRHPFAGAVLSSPMIDIEIPAVPRLLRAYVRAAVRLGFGRTFAPGEPSHARKDRIFDKNPLTGDRDRFQRGVTELEKNPRLALGGVTHGWLDAAFTSIDRVTAPAFARGLTLPLIIVRAAADRIVSSSAQTRFCRLAPDCRIVDVPGAGHEILMETDARRQVFWQAFDRFTAELVS